MPTLFVRAHSFDAERLRLAIALTGVRVRVVEAERAPAAVGETDATEPLLDDGDRLVAGTLAILRRLDELSSERRLYPREASRRAEAEMAVEWFERVWRRNADAILAEESSDRPNRDVIRRAAYAMQARLELFERLLDGRDHLLGDFGVLDCLAFPFLRFASETGVRRGGLADVLARHMTLGPGHRRLAGWIERTTARLGGASDSDE